MPEGEDLVSSQVAGFIVWLVDQRFECDYRRRCPWIAERFLRWQLRRRRQQLPSNVNAYCRELAIDGVADDELNDVRQVISDLDKFLKTTSQPPAT